MYAEFPIGDVRRGHDFVVGVTFPESDHLMLPVEIMSKMGDMNSGILSCTHCGTRR